MRITELQAADLLRRIEASLARGKLSRWETVFLQDMRSKLSGSANPPTLSERQLSKIREVTGPLFDTPPGAKSTHMHMQTRRQGPWAPHKVSYGRRAKDIVRKEVGWWRRRLVRDFAVALALLALILVFGIFRELRNFSQPSAQPGVFALTKSEFSVTDGDTIHLHSETRGMRLVGFNAPETFHPNCSKGLELGLKATQRLKELIDAADTVTVRRVACSCRPGTEGTSRCNYGRSCGYLFADGKDVGPILISEGLAAPYSCGLTGCPPPPRPWCPR